MVMQGLRMRSWSTTLMGTMRGVLDVLGSPLSDAFLYGGTGHAFLMNLHNELCPSSPYCWNRAGFVRLARNLGVEIVELGFLHGGSSLSERAAMEAKIRELMDAGSPCSLLNMEHQLITGYDESGFDTAQPWAPKLRFPPARLSFGSWAELGGEIHVSFFSFSPVEPVQMSTAVVESLRYAIDLYRNPGSHSGAPYAVGGGAWDNWIGAVRKGHGGSHGNWWNGAVWSECRLRASEYLAEVAGVDARFGRLGELARVYREIGGILGSVSDKGMEAERKTALLERGRELEARAIRELEGSEAIRL